MNLDGVSVGQCEAVRVAACEGVVAQRGDARRTVSCRANRHQPREALLPAGRHGPTEGDGHLCTPAVSAGGPLEAYREVCGRLTPGVGVRAFVVGSGNRRQRPAFLSSSHRGRLACCVVGACSSQCAGRARRIPPAAPAYGPDPAAHARRASVVGLMVGPDEALLCEPRVRSLRAPPRGVACASGRRIRSVMRSRVAESRCACVRGAPSVPRAETSACLSDPPIPGQKSPIHPKGGRSCHGCTLHSRPPGIHLVLHRLHVRFYVSEPLPAMTGRSPHMRRC